jgi:hypothetical protein
MLFLHRLWRVLQLALESVGLAILVAIYIGIVWNGIRSILDPTGSVGD